MGGGGPKSLGRKSLGHSPCSLVNCSPTARTRNSQGVPRLFRPGGPSKALAKLLAHRGRHIDINLVWAGAALPPLRPHLPAEGVQLLAEFGVVPPAAP